MNKTIAVIMLTLVGVTGLSAAQQPVTTITSGTGTSGLNLKQYNDTYINPRLTNIAANDTDLYTNKADKSSFSSSSAFAAAWGWNPGVSNYNDLTNKPVADVDYLTPTGSAANLTNFPATLATDSEVSAAVAGKESSLGNPSTSGWCLQSTNGGVRSWGVCGGLADAGADGKTYGRKNSAWVEVPESSQFVNINATLPLVWDSLTANMSLQVDTDLTSVSENDDTIPSAKAVKTALGSVSTADTKINWTTTTPTSANAAGIWVNTTTGHTYIVGTQGVVDIPSTITVADIIPNPFGFNTITDATPGADYWSNPVTITGIDHAATVSATTAYRINGGDAITAASEVSLNDTVALRLTASNTAGATVTGNASIGGLVGSPAFSVTTSSSTSYVLSENNVAVTGSEALFASTGGKGQDFIPTSTKLLRSVQVYVTSYSEGAQIQCRYDSTADMTTPLDTATSAVITSTGYATVDFGADHTLTSGTPYYFGCVYLNAPASIGYAADSYASGSYRYTASQTGWNLGTATTSKDLVFRVTGE